MYANFTGSNSYSDDYKDGSGNSVRSKYHRYSASTTIGLSPDDNKKFEFSAGTSNGYAYYADRTMDGTKFLRENYGFKSQIKDISYFVESLDFQLARNKIFHTMSEIPRGGSNYMDVRNDLYSARILSNLNLRTTTKAKIGFDWSESTHSGNMPTMGMPNFSDDLIYRQTSFFAELTEILQGGQRIILGLS